MTTITRKDGVEFVVQPYRELLAIKNFNLLKREIRFLAESNGAFVRLFKQPNGHFEAVFCHDPGFLLGETVWDHFGRPDNLVYCEALDNDRILIVIVRSGAVYIDGEFSKEELIEELAVIKTIKQKFAIYVYGDVPNAETEDEKEQCCHFGLTAKQVKTFVRLDKAVFPQLQAVAGLQLLTLEQALQQHSVNKSLIATVVISLFIVIIAGIGLWKHQHTVKQVEKSQVDPFLAFKMGLRTPSPQQQLQALKDDIDMSYTMPGWIATQINYSAGGNTSHLHFQIHSIGGNLEQLFHWEKTNNATVNLGTQGADLDFKITLDSRKAPTVIYNSEKVSARIIDEMMQVLPGRSVHINQITTKHRFKETQMTINVNHIAPNVLPIIGGALVGLPVKLNKVNLQVDHGLLTGSIQLMILGN